MSVDIIDKAQELEELQRSAALSRCHREVLATQSTECAECGCAIGTARKKALPSARLCLSCQAQWEVHHGI
ncbi:MAG: TraR/DksA C4-type zinc finger protein [Vibrio sp.]